jgi:hypothetical protein
MASALKDDQVVLSVFADNPDLARDEYETEWLIARIIEQLRLAIANDAVLLGGHAVRNLIARVFALAKADLQESSQESESPSLLSFGQRTFDLFGFDWRCCDFSSFREVRQSSEIRKCAAGFRQAIGDAGRGADISQRLLGLMRSAMEKEEVASKAKGAYATKGILSSVAGAIIPCTGKVASLFSFTSYLGEKHQERIEQEHKWYLMGPKMREISLKKILEQCVPPQDDEEQQE